MFELDDEKTCKFTYGLMVMQVPLEMKLKWQSALSWYLQNEIV
jgi:hypothetical protein